MKKVFAICLVTIGVTACVDTTQSNVGARENKLGVLSVPWDQQEFFPAVEVCYKETTSQFLSSRHSTCMANILNIDLKKYKIASQQYATHRDAIYSYCSTKLNAQISKAKTPSGMYDATKATKQQYRCLFDSFQVHQVTEVQSANALRTPNVQNPYRGPGDMMASVAQTYQANMAAFPPNPYLEQQARQREERMRAEENDVNCTSRWIGNQLITECR